MVRTGADELTGFVPACPGDEINIGVGADQDLVDDSDVSIIDHEGRFAGANPGVVEFTLSPQAVNSGALTDSVPLSDFSTGYALPVEDLAGVGEFYVSTSRTYASARLYEGDLPELGSAWLFEGAGFETVVDVDIDRERDLLVQSAECDASPR
ncbi:hypothetical protein [Demequina sp.]|uniref:hypothetical protein n=1 Tax=Demequina sp. TaxID=2050685 RepID=UPI0025B7CD56|nr:hypothetical protein [Demequina sp.]